jgi:ATP-dependent RNA helicase DeaD
MNSFEEMGLAPALLKSITEMGFDNPTPIQEGVVPFLLKTPKDLVGLAQTGTGKTAAFGLPILQKINTKMAKTQALILSPTRELCLQISGEMRNFAKYMSGLNIVSVYGGSDMARQIKAVAKGAHIIVATPGRMNDLLNKQRRIDLSNLRFAVLDEADEMLNMGFKEDLDAILNQTPDSKVTLLFSATMPRAVQTIAKNYLEDPHEVTVGTRNAGVEAVDHVAYAVRSHDRYLALKRIVDYHPDIYGIIFCRTRVETKDVAAKLIQDGYIADALHGELSQPQRETIMHKFRIKNLQILVATDVAARGLDVKDITHIINYNLPDEVDLYIHRSGRTGRAGQRGVSIAIVNLREKHKIRMIESRLRRKFEQKMVPTGKGICEKQLLNLVDKMQKIEVDHKEIDKFLPAVSEKLEWLSREELIKHFVSLEFNRLLDYYKDAKDLNAPDEERRPRSRPERESSSRKEGRRGAERLQRKENPRDAEERPPRKEGRRGAEAGYSRFQINLGYKDSLTPRDLIGLINRCSHNRHMDIGKIELMNSSSWFEVDQKYTTDVLAGFAGIEYNKRNVLVEMDDGQAKQETDKPGRHTGGSETSPTSAKRPIRKEYKTPSSSGIHRRKDRKPLKPGEFGFNKTAKKKPPAYSDDRSGSYQEDRPPAKRKKINRTK